jgi:hypothetical protein
MRLGCRREAFELVLTSLKLLGEVEEDSVHRLHLVGVPLKRNARPPQLPTAPQVVNIKALPKGWRDDPAYAGYVYIGRAHSPRRLPALPWGNPFEIGRDGSRVDVIAKYRVWIETQPHLLQTIPHLARVEALVCWCAPDACHGDVLVGYVDRWRRGEWQPPSRQGALGYNDIETRAALRARLEGRAGLL